MPFQLMERSQCSFVIHVNKIISSDAHDVINSAKERVGGRPALVYQCPKTWVKYLKIILRLNLHCFNVSNVCKNENRSKYKIQSVSCLGLVGEQILMSCSGEGRALLDCALSRPWVGDERENQSKFRGWWWVSSCSYKEWNALFVSQYFFL